MHFGVEVMQDGAVSGSRAGECWKTKCRDLLEVRCWNYMH
jgi:hypothetical protein